MESVAGILENLPTTVIGLVALGTLIIGGIAYAFFKNEHWALRLVSFLVVVIGFGLLVFAFVAGTMPQTDADASDQPPAVVSAPVGADVSEIAPTPSSRSACADGDLVCLTEQMNRQEGN